MVSRSYHQNWLVFVRQLGAHSVREGFVGRHGLGASPPTRAEYEIAKALQPILPLVRCILCEKIQACLSGRFTRDLPKEI
eukprot:scaffold4387_cov400-Prasinococcus_capsulatus_cf.AAC.5